MIVATRTLTLKDADGSRPLPVTLLAPERQEDGAFACAVEIGWPEGAARSLAFGVDAVQALLIALQMAGTHLYTSEHHRAGRLSFGDGEGGYGFPVPPNLRAMLTGHDADAV